MSIQGIVFIDLLGLGFIVLILNLVRKHNLVVGYALLWILAVVSMMVLVTVTPLRDTITRLVGAEYPASAVSLLAFVFIFLMLIYFSVQLSVMSRRQVELMQTIAIMEQKIHEKDNMIKELSGKPEQT
jgi:hypothetical protein